MVDTVRSLNDLLSNLFQDGQSAGISANDLRDLLVSSIGQTGWASYQDATYTSGSPQLLPASTNTAILNDGTVNQTQELPIGVPQLYDAATDTILAPSVGAGILITYEGIFSRQSGTAQWDLDVHMDIGLPGPVRLYPRSYSINNGGGDKFITFSTGAYTLDTWDANGAQIIVNPSVDAQVYQSRVIIHQLHRGRGTYS